ncbi:MAG: LacI family transcriptional regulator [Lachnospiraceae bacterium]|nr:LacI family transcriptional regulator [Lachnospiraceae bacterium]
MVTIKDIARYADVSIATVSRYLNHKLSVKPETEAKIQEAIRELNYVPNIVAQSLKANRTNNVAVVIPNIHALYYAEITSGISSVLSGYDYNLFIFEVDYIRKDDEEILKSLQENRIAGAIFVSLSFDERFYKSLDILLDVGVPVVYANRPLPYQGIPLVYPDFALCGKLAASHLLEKGRTRLGLVHSLSENSGLYRMHVESFSEPLKKAGLAAPGIISSPLDADPSESCLKMIEDGNYDGLFVLNELMASKLSRSLQYRGYRIPDDISVLGFGNSVASEITTPALSCINLQNYNLGIESARKIMAKIMEETFEPVTVLEPYIIQRAST